MAHEVLPHHRAHEQLRTEAPRQRDHTDKYVTCISSGEAEIDLTFTNPVLQKSADHFKVGIDNLTANLGSLSMLEYGRGDVLFRVLRRGEDGQQDEDFFMVDGPATDLEKFRDAFAFKVDRIYSTLQEVLSRFKEIGEAVTTYVSDNGLQNGGGANDWEFTRAAGSDFTVLKIDVTSNGQIRFAGNSVFWANFVINVPLPKYRHIFFKTMDHTEFISLHPVTGAVHQPYDYIVDLPNPTLLETQDFVPVFNGAFGNEGLLMSYVGEGNLLNTLDRRVTIEVGCSLPIKNSPLIDHGVEAPDFVLGRYMFHKPYTMSLFNGELDLESHSLGVQTLQGPRDRVVFHHLQPQQKITTLRLKLWARVRTFNETTKKWGMQTIVCPVSDGDYWHIRLHFVSK